MEFDVPIYQAGSFDYFVKYTPLPEYSPDQVPVPKPTSTPKYYIDIQPNLKLNGKHVPLDALAMISCLSKFMGRYPEDWDNHFRGISQRGYNMIHFTPLTTRGSSNSPYSIYDQHQFDPEKFPNGEKDVADMVQRMEKDHNLLALTDVVWNHTADNSKWLQEHPEAGYNMETAPWLECAYELDTKLLEYSDKLQSLGKPTTINSMDDLLNIMDGVKGQVIGAIKLWEYYVLDLDRDTAATIAAWKEGKAEFPGEGFGTLGTNPKDASSWPLKQKAAWLMENALLGGDRLGERFRRRIEPVKGAALLAALFGRYDSRVTHTADERAAHGAMYRFLEEVNGEFYKEYDADVAEIMEQLFNRTKYVRLDDHGPKLGPITKQNPLIETYFTRLPQNETTKKHNPRSLGLVNNGWIWAADAMRDNAGPKSKAYVRREVIVWGDCVKLRYGADPQDSPYLWEHMAKYTRLMAKYFGGFRIDNCHSTPIHLAEYMLDQARQVRPDICVFAELFTGSEEMDYKFVQRLGINALIREAMQAWSTQEVSRLVWMHAGRPIGSFEINDVNTVEKPSEGMTNGVSSKRESIHRIRRCPLGALFTDCTHDNEMPAQKRDARDTLPNAALVSMCASATGSVMGYDEVYPKLIELVHETRPYESTYSKPGASITAGKGGPGGIGGPKKLLNQIHTTMGREGYEETYIHHDREYITVHRLHPITRKGYFLIAHTAFPGYGNGNGGFPPVTLPDTKAKLLGAWTLEVDQSNEAKSAAIDDKNVLRGLPSQVKEIHDFGVRQEGGNTVLTVPDNFPPGSAAVFETSMPGAEHGEGLDHIVTSGAKDAFANLDLTDLNMVLYRCEPEERDASNGTDGTYNIPGHGNLVYAGLQGWWSPLEEIVRENNLGHPICNHLREGTWAMDYCVGRLDRLASKSGYSRLQGPAKWMRERVDILNKIPSTLRPRYFALLIQTAYNAAVDRSFTLMNDTVQKGQSFVRSLALVSVQMIGNMNNASLWPQKLVPSMAAGLPHFSNDWGRVWGRDVMISLRGLCLGTGRFTDAREHILAFGSVIKHGMVPNLVGSGKIPRYNSRDSVWFYLQNIQDYTKMAPNGIEILQDSAPRRFIPYDDTWFPWDDKRAYSQSSTIEDVIQECLQRHAAGMDFTEANAGPGIDSQMKDAGFHLKIQTDWKTGIIYGGNQHNCGTWMDKMGESEKAGSKGVPGTPRDGAAVEITGMLYSTLKWVDELHRKGLYKYDSVKIHRNKDTVTFKDWAKKIKDNFERCYYVPTDAGEDKQYDVNPKVVNRRGIYKDLHKSGKEYEDYQLRPNFPIAMTVAPDLFNVDHALNALAVADKALRGPLGMATLDPSDYNYRPYYINSEDSTDFHTSKGRNYHQGPEWVWPTGFFLRAFLIMNMKKAKTQEEKIEIFQQITKRLAGCREAIKQGPWKGLTELTQKNGEFCPDSVSLRYCLIIRKS